MKLASGFCIPEPLPVHTGMKSCMHSLDFCFRAEWMKSVLISTSFSSFICSWLASRCIQRSPSQQRFPWELQLKEQILKEQITDGRVFFKMSFRPCLLGCGRLLSVKDGHERCLQCLSFQHVAFVDDSCACCGRMSMTSLRSRLSLLKGLAPSATTRAGLSGSSRGPLVGALGDLRITVRASPLGTSPRTSYSSRSERPVRDPAFNSVRPLRKKVWRGCPPSGVVAPRYTSSKHHSGVSPLLQPLDGPCLSTGRGAHRTSVPACCCHNRCLQHRLGRYMQQAGSLGAQDRALTALAHQLPRAVGSASSLMAVPATAVRQACVSSHGQHCGCLVHQQPLRYTITPHVTARPSSPTLESHAAQITACCPHPREAQTCGRCALMTAHVPRRMGTPSRDNSADLESIRGSSGRPSHESSHWVLESSHEYSPSARMHWHTAGLMLYANMRFPQWAYSHRHCAWSGRTRSRSWWSRRIAHPERTWFPK